MVSIFFFMIMLVFRVGEERRTLEAQLAKVTNTNIQTQIRHLLFS